MLIYILIVFCCAMLFIGGWIVGFIHGYTRRNRKGKKQTEAENERNIRK